MAILPSPRRSTRVFIDVTRTHDSPHHTGIQKVIRGLYRALDAQASDLGVAVVPVVLTDDGALALPELPLHEFERDRPAPLPEARTVPDSEPAKGGPSWTVRMRRRLSEQLERFRLYLWSRRDESRLAAATLLLLRNVNARLRALLARRRLPVPRKQPVVAFAKGDVLLMPDSSWLINPWPAAEQVRAAGGRIATIWYDLIPIHHPDFFVAELPPLFRTYFERLLETSDVMMPISRTVADEIRSHASQHAIDPPRLVPIWPGVETASPPPHVAASLDAVFSRPTIVIVATLEPRKGHALLVEACEAFWRDGRDVNLVVIGKVGWRVEDLRRRIHGHQEYGKRLFHFDDLNDGEVSFVLGRADVMAFPSVAEGFGLPILEAELVGCRVVCSDIPVFREVASAETLLFSPRTPAALAAALDSALVAARQAGSRATVAATRDPEALGYRRYAREVAASILRDTSSDGTKGNAGSTRQVADQRP
jgi:glycosyltransferase involved in cell wall biosynthesis